MGDRKVTVNNARRPVISNLRLPDAHYQPGDTVDVHVDGAVVTIRPAATCTELPPEMRAAPTHYLTTSDVDDVRRTTT